MAKPERQMIRKQRERKVGSEEDRIARLERERLRKQQRRKAVTEED
jgi:hypothetical protein